MSRVELDFLVVAIIAGCWSGCVGAQPIVSSWYGRKRNGLGMRTGVCISSFILLYVYLHRLSFSVLHEAVTSVFAVSP